MDANLAGLHHCRVTLASRLARTDTQEVRSGDDPAVHDARAGSRGHGADAIKGSSDAGAEPGPLKALSPGDRSWPLRLSQGLTGAPYLARVPVLLSHRDQGRSLKAGGPQPADWSASCSGTGSHAGSHPGERPSGIPNGHEQREGTRPRSRTDLNRSGRPHMELRIRRLGVRVPPSALDIRRSGATFSGVRGGLLACQGPCLSQSLTGAAQRTAREGKQMPAARRVLQDIDPSHG
jgi:hypothetical protein